LLTDDEIVARARQITDDRQRERVRKAQEERHRRYQEESAKIKAKLKAEVDKILLCNVTDQQLDDIIGAVDAYREDCEYL